MFFIKFFTFIVFSFLFLYADSNNSIDINKTKIALKAELNAQDKEIEKNNIWIKSYNDFLSYRELKLELKKTVLNIKKIKRLYRTKKRAIRLKKLKQNQKLLMAQLTFLEEQTDIPFSKLVRPQNIPSVVYADGPFAIFSAFNYIELLKNYKENYTHKINNISNIIDWIEYNKNIYLRLYNIEKTKETKEKLDNITKKLLDFEDTLVILATTSNVYNRKIDQNIFIVNESIKAQLKRISFLTITIIILFVLAFLLKLVIKRYIRDNERYYMANKIISFSSYTIAILILVISNLNDGNGALTFLGFASAGIAIAMKDWFMSILGWTVIVIGGSIHVGDRIRVERDGMIYVGDVMDISLLRMTLLEDITLTSIVHNRRAGRIILVPNNYIFTSLIANYTHSTLKTVWDGIDIMVTFDSNHKKAAHIVKTITRKYSKGYTDITRKQLNRLRDKYSLKNANVDPRIYTFIEENGMRVSSWYLTNAYATLTLRSTISAEIVEEFNKEEDITIAYPTQKLYIDSRNVIEEKQSEPNV